MIGGTEVKSMVHERLKIIGMIRECFNCNVSPIESKISSRFIFKGRYEWRDRFIAVVASNRKSLAERVRCIVSLAGRFMSASEESRRGCQAGNRKGSLDQTLGAQTVIRPKRMLHKAIAMRAARFAQRSGVWKPEGFRSIRQESVLVARTEPPINPTSAEHAKQKTLGNGAQSIELQKRFCNEENNAKKKWRPLKEKQGRKQKNIFVEAFL